MKKLNRKLRLNEWIIIICGVAVMCSTLTSIYFGVSMSVVEAERDNLIKECNSIQIELNVAEANIESYLEDNNNLKDELELLGRQIEDMNAEIMKVEKELVEYKKESANYFINRYELSDDELEVLWKIVEAEARGQSFEAKVNVCHSILNRVYSEKFPDTVRQVVFQPRQYQPTFDGAYYRVNVTDHTKDAVYYATRSQDTTDGALFFMNESISDEGAVSWFKSKLTYIMTDDANHSFYK